MSRVLCGFIKDIIEFFSELDLVYRGLGMSVWRFRSLVYVFRNIYELGLCGLGLF